MTLIPNDHTIPTLYSTENESNPICQLKLFTPDSNWIWYIIEMDEQKELCFGYVVGFEQELGYFTLSELQNIRGVLNLPVERDLSFAPTPLDAVKEIHHD